MSAELDDSDDYQDCVISTIESDVKRQLINLFNSSINTDGFIQLTQITLGLLGFDFAQRHKNGYFLSDIEIKLNDLDGVVIIQIDRIANQKKIFNFIVIDNIDQKNFDDLNNSQYDHFIVSKSVITTHEKNKLSKYEKLNFFDIDDIFSMAREKIMLNKYIDKILFHELIYPYLESRVGSLTLNKNVVIGGNLIEKITKCPKGISGWKEFETIIESTLEYLFKDSIDYFQMKSQASNSSGTDRRDFIIVNDGKGGFWDSIRKFYDCNNIIVECKNSSDYLHNTDLRQVSDYLEKSSIGRFGLIFSRLGLAENTRIRIKSKTCGAKSGLKI